MDKVCRLALKDNLTIYILKGVRNQDLPAEITAGKDKDIINFQANEIRRCLKKYSRAKEYAELLIKIYPVEKAQRLFNDFCLMSKPFQKAMLKSLRQKKKVA